MQYNITIREKDKGVQYIISYKDADGKWRQKSKQGFKLKGDAKAAAQADVRKLERKVTSQANLNKEYEGKTFKEFRDIYIKHISLTRQGNTVVAYVTTFNNFSELNDKEILKISSADIQKCTDEMVENGLGSKTIKLYLSRLHTAFNYAVKPLKMIDVNPVRDIDVIAKKESKFNKKALTKSELADLLHKIKDRKYFMISLIAAKCGLRIGEILGLTLDDIDERKCIINVHQQWKIIKETVGEKNEYEYGFGELKSKNSYRKVPVPPDVIREIKKYKKEYPINIDKRLFDFYNTQSISQRLIATYRKIGYDISVHELRHTYGTMLIANGLDFKTVAQLMGHDVEQTIHTYSHVTTDMEDRATKLINKIF